MKEFNDPEDDFTRIPARNELIILVILLVIIGLITLSRFF